MPANLDLETLVRRHQVGVWRYLRALGADANVAEDLLQETFLVAFDKLVEDRGPAAVASFLRTVAKNLFLRHRRDHDRREAALVELADRLWQRDCAADEGDMWLAALRDCLRRVDGRSAEAVELFYRQSLSREDVAERLGLKGTGLKTLLQRLRAGLRGCIEKRIQGEQR